MDIVFLLYEGMTALDLVGPLEVLSRLPGAVVKGAVVSPDEVSCCRAGLILSARYQLDEISQADILIVPGAGTITTLQKYPQALQWIRDIHRTTTWTTSVCTGSQILGAAGILKGVKATSHWAVLECLSRWGAVPTPGRMVVSGKIVTAAGVSAGIDMALMLAAKLAGEEIAKSIQLMIEYDPAPPFDCGSPQKADPATVKKLKEQVLAKFNQALAGDR